MKTTCTNCHQREDERNICLSGMCLKCMNDSIHEKMRDDAQNEKMVLARAMNIAKPTDRPLITEDIASSGATFNYAIVNKDKVAGEEQDDVEFSHGPPFVNQTTDGGMSGDDFAGDVFIPLSNSEYLKYSYVM